MSLYTNTPELLNWIIRTATNDPLPWMNIRPPVEPRDTSEVWRTYLYPTYTNMLYEYDNVAASNTIWHVGSVAHVPKGPLAELQT